MSAAARGRLLLLFGYAATEHSYIGEQKLELWSSAAPRLIHQYKANIAAHPGRIDESTRAGAIRIDEVGARYRSLHGRPGSGEILNKIAGAIRHKAAQKTKGRPQRA